MATPAHAQAPVPTSPAQPVVGFAVICQQAMLEVDYQGLGVYNCAVHDLSKDSPVLPGQGSTVSAIQHTTELRLGDHFPTHAEGWHVILGRNVIPTISGEVTPFTVVVQTTPLVNVQDYMFTLLANYTGPNGERLNQTVTLYAQVNPYDLAHVETVEVSKRAGQNEVVQYVVAVTNDGVYPDGYQFDVIAPPGFQVSIPPSVYAPPGQTRNVTINILTPKDKLYDLGSSSAFIFKVSSTTGTGVYSSVGVLKVSGPYVPSYWIPLLAVALIAGAITVTKARERAGIRRLERGRPRRVALTPRQQVLLAELKKADPEAYDARRAQLAAVYVARRAHYRDAHREQMKKDREERREARAEFKAAKRRHAVAAKEQKRRDKATRREARRLAAAEAKSVKKKERQLRKTQKLLEKARSKQAKLDAKQAKRDAKLAARDLAAQAKADKEAARAAKRAEKAARKRPPGDNP